MKRYLLTTNQQVRAYPDGRQIDGTAVLGDDVNVSRRLSRLAVHDFSQQVLIVAGNSLSEKTPILCRAGHVKP